MYRPRRATCVEYVQRRFHARYGLALKGIPAAKRALLELDVNVNGRLDGDGALPLGAAAGLDVVDEILHDVEVP